MSKRDDYAILMERLDYAGSERLRRILEHLMNSEQASLAAALPGTVAEAAQKTGIPAQRAKALLDDMYYKGVAFPRDFDNRDLFRAPRSIIQLHDASQADGRLDVVKDKHYYELWHDFCTHELYPRLGKARASQTQPRSRIVPSYKAVKDTTGMLPCEDIREILKAQSLIAAVPCSCRYRTTSVGQHCAHAHEEDRWNCLQFGRGAEYALKRGSGRKLSIDEALSLAAEIEEDGLLHIWANNSDLTGFNLACQCCRDCCQTYVPMDMAKVPIGNIWAKSRYEAAVNVDDCNGCEKCVERCQFDAIQMKGGKAVVQADKCFGCGACVIGCAPDAMSFKLVRPPEHIPGATDKSLI